MKKAQKKKKKDKVGVSYCLVCDEYWETGDDMCPSCGNPVSKEPMDSENASKMTVKTMEKAGCLLQEKL